jgi:hypothetical protein
VGTAGHSGIALKVSASTAGVKNPFQGAEETAPGYGHDSCSVAELSDAGKRGAVGLGKETCETLSRGAELCQRPLLVATCPWRHGDIPFRDFGSATRFPGRGRGVKPWRQSADMATGGRAQATIVVRKIVVASGDKSCACTPRLTHAGKRACRRLLSPRRKRLFLVRIPVSAWALSPCRRPSPATRNGRGVASADLPAGSVQAERDRC